MRETHRDLPTYPFAHLGQFAHRFLLSGACGTERRARVDASAQLLQPAHSLSHGLSSRPCSPPKTPSRVAVASKQNACDTYECAHACCLAADLRPCLGMAVPHLRLVSLPHSSKFGSVGRGKRIPTASLPSGWERWGSGGMGGLRATEGAVM